MALYVEQLGRGDARVVLVHGFTQTGRVWLPLAVELAALGLKVVLPDLPGHGGSTDVRANLWDTARLLADTCGQGVYVGYSLGGRACLHVALRRPEVLRGLVLISTTAGLDTPAERAERRAADGELATLIERDGVASFLDRWLAQPLFARLPKDGAHVAERHRNSAEGLATSLRWAGTGTQEPLWDRLWAIEVPVLVMAGAEDERFVVAAERLAASIGDNARLQIVPEAGHALHLEQPDRFVLTLLDWLRASGLGPAGL